ncbi:MAG TPA: hypothetical protein VG963_34410, partial [Polyangiaceae bacterium]|nr:hypothetical protein [Polyangiaceae bacterium]
PHVEHLYFLATLARRAGHECVFLACDADLPDCYTRELRERPGWRECLQCRAGGIRSFTGENVASLGKYPAHFSDSMQAPDDWANASASTLGRFEADSDYSSEEFRALVARLRPAVQIGFEAARRWMMAKRVDAMCVFNGRIDVTRAIFEAAKSLGIRVVSLERTWFGDGLQLFPEENCLGLRTVDEMVRAWKDRPLKEAQAVRAAAHAARRFLRINLTEWRAYNTNAKESPWPIAQAPRRILLLPGSRNEVWGHPDWASGWAEPSTGFEALIEHFQLEPHEVVLRCHPNWAEKIGKRDGSRSETYYTNWAARRGILSIPSADPTSTMHLIAQADAIVVSNSSAALEAGILGKQVIGTAPSVYQEAGFRDRAYDLADVRSLVLDRDRDSVAAAEATRRRSRQALRFCYTMAYRLSQYTDCVIAESTTRYRYDLSASPQRFIELLKTGRLTADDEDFAQDASQEDGVLDAIAREQWSSLCERAASLPRRRPQERITRRALMRAVDLISDWKPVGDR